MAHVASLRTVFLMVSVAFAVGSVAEGQVLCRSEADDVAALRTFYRAVNDYVELHRALEDPMSPERLCSDPEAIAASVDALAGAITMQRRSAAQGDIFGPEVADLFRARLEVALGKKPRHDWAAVPDLPPDSEEAPGIVYPTVNARFALAGSVPMSEAMAHALPTLPPELEYRLVGRTLVLVDVGAELVVDLIEDALP